RVAGRVAPLASTPPAGEIETPVGVPLLRVLEIHDTVLLEKRDQDLPRGYPLVTQADPGTGAPPEFHRLVREIEEEAPAGLHFADPEAKGVPPLPEVLQAMRAEDEIE